VSCSIGVSIYPDDGITTDSLIATADKAMYNNKHKK
jgi:GGDEF domain-containing protein